MLRFAVYALCAILCLIFSPLIAVYAVYYLFFYVHRPDLMFLPSRRNKSLISHCPSLTSRYWPTFYLPNGHLQTFFVLLRPFPSNQHCHRLDVPTEDGGQISIDIFEECGDNSSPTVILFHGLAGGSNSSYIRNLAHRLNKKRIRAVALNARGCNETPLKTSRHYCVSCIDDAKKTIEFIHIRYPASKLFAVGFSLGANWLTKYLGEEGDRTPLSAGVSVANPFDFEVLADWIDQPFNRVTYNKRLVSELLKFVSSHERAFSQVPGVDISAVMDSKTLREFDLNLTIKVFGYETVDQYYRHGSSRYYISGIAIPHLVLACTDDPMMPAHQIAYQECLSNPNVILVVTKKGGHCGWFKGLSVTETWFDDVIEEWIDACLKIK